MAPGSAGVYGTLPGGFTSANSALGVNPANVTAHDYSLCGVVSGRSAGSGGPSTAGGNGCVVFRCVAP